MSDAARGQWGLREAAEAGRTCERAPAQPGGGPAAGGRGVRGGRRSAAGLALLAVLASAGPALAILPPQFYQQARENAPNVVVLKVKHVGQPPEPRGAGVCAVAGTVVKVERGTSYQPGQAITVPVHCVRPGGKALIGPFFYRPVAELRAARYGRAFLDAEGRLVLSQYDMLEGP